MNLSFRLFVSILLISVSTVFAQQKQVSGKIIDSQGLPLPGVGLAYIMRTNDGQGVYGDVQAVSDLKDIYDTDDVRLGILGYEGSRLRNLGKYPNFQGFDNIPIIRYEEVVLTYGEALIMDWKRLWCSYISKFGCI